MRAAVRGVRTALGTAPSLEQLAAALRGADRPFLLHGRWGLPAAAPSQSRAIVAGAEPRRTADPLAADPFAVLSEVPPLAGQPPADGFVGGGWAGWLGHDLGRRVEPTLGPQPPRPIELPAVQLGWFDSVLRRDEHGEWWVEGLADDALPDAEQQGWLDAIAERWRDRLAEAAGQEPIPGRLGELTIAAGGELGHRAAVAEAVERIYAGELFQANVCLRLQGEIEGEAAGLAAPVLAATDPWYGAWFDAGKQRGIVSASPELFLRRTGNAVMTAPIKGTAPREAGVAEPDAAALELLRSTKDAAEHVMIVDLMRNDLGRVCDYGSITADRAPRLEPHAGVWHLVSHVTGTLHAGLGDGSLVRACFPPGSVTGAPKVQAQRVIAAVESTGREVYTGAHGIVGPACGLELAVTIRTIEYSGDQAWVGVGGGIVADSTPEGELAEALRKASALVAAGGGTISAPASDAAAALRGVRWLPSAARRPDPARGVIETILVTDGYPEHLGLHLQRLSRAAAEIGLPALPAGLEDVLLARAAGSHGRRRLRIALRAGAVPRIELLPIGEAEGAPLQLAPWVVPGGVGPLKWADRDLLNELTGAGRLPLLLENDGTVLEAAYANVWWVRGDELCTPPADGRVLPGISRGVVLAAGEVAGLQVREATAWLDQIAELPLLVTSARGAQAAALSGSPPAAIERAVALARQVGEALVDPAARSHSAHR